MYINEKFKITADDLNVVVEEKIGVIDRETKEVKYKWKAVAYCRDCESALNFILQKEVRKTELKDLSTVIKKIEEVQKDIKNISKRGVLC